MTKKVLFVHDGPIYVSDDQKYYGVHYTNKIVERYAYFGDIVSFMTRSQRLIGKVNTSFSLIDHEKFDFIDIPNFKSILTRINIKRAKRIIHKSVENHDILIIRFPSAIGVLAYRHAKKLGKPVLIEVVACVFDALWNYDWRGKMIAHYKMASYKKIIADASHVMYVTDHFLQSRYPTNGKQIGCSDVVVRIDGDVLSKRMDKIKNKSDLSLVLGTVAALDVAYKGQADVIEAIFLLKKRGIRIAYHLVGQGDSTRLRKIIERLDLSEEVKIIGPLTHDQVFDFYRQIDVYVQPSKLEGLPRAVIEAMSEGCLVMGSNVGGIPELIVQDFLFPVSDIPNIASLIRSIDREALEVQAKRNIEEAKKYDPKKLEVKRLAFYEEFKKDYGL